MTEWEKCGPERIWKEIEKEDSLAVRVLFWILMLPVIAFHLAMHIITLGRWLRSDGPQVD